jgi:hypothetical protein
MKAQKDSNVIALLLLTSALDGVVGWRHAPASYPLEWRSAHYIGGWVGFMAGLDSCGKSLFYKLSIPGPI